ncbi:hypothetical protein GS429_04140 [Natronorubrum sp. JWXQ-INN-674]|uniref:Uncharacterized protein n=1 Tax=Natronorubrum halalkaliphilum TaxID=2691917 RepID=A0A6B0VJJ6_9EURY|nr:hypothetical protein [Natronorubrum halalkaliphilum]MXV61265.1 hypothetical protein [Natronorubrum halalkaliphilum]
MLFNAIGPFEGATGELVEPGEYVLDVDADGAWSISIRQPEPAGTDADVDDLPVELQGEHADWAGPIGFDGLVEAHGTHAGDANFIVEVFPVDEPFPELVFNEIGPFEGETTLRADGVGYVVVEADGPWTLEVR